MLREAKLGSRVSGASAMELAFEIALHWVHDPLRNSINSQQGAYDLRRELRLFRFGHGLPRYSDLRKIGGSTTRS